MKARDYVISHMPKNSTGIEIGVHRGDYSNKILESVDPQMLHLIDPWKNFTEKTYDKSWYGSKVTQDDMDKRYQSVVNRFSNKKNVNIIRDYSYNAINQFKDNSIDWVYIDGDHSYEGVYKDFVMYYDKVKPGGFIYGDDYTDTRWWGTDVIDALHTVLNEKSLKIVFLIENQFCCVKTNT